MFPKVFTDFIEHQERYSDTSVLPTPICLRPYRLDPGDEAAIEIEKGKTLIVQFLAVGDLRTPMAGGECVFRSSTASRAREGARPVGSEPEVGQRAKATAPEAIRTEIGGARCPA